MNKKSWYEKNREKILLKKKEEYTINRDFILAKNKANREKFKLKRSESTKIDRKLNPNKYKDRDLKKKFGISLDTYNKMLAEQNYKCYICHRHENEFKRKLAVDHCHKTGKIRKLLCEKCNVGLGSFYENIDIIKNAIEYLKGNNNGIQK